MRSTLIGAVLMLTAADHWTTWLCLREPVTGFVVTEANPFAAWLFGSTGLVAGLALDSVVTFGALLFLAGTRRFSPRLKNAMLAFVALATTYAVTNNVLAIVALGLGPFGAA
jgi:hypothetical protein